MWLILFGFGVIFGSFINALVWRLHMQAEQAEKAEREPKKTQTRSKKTASGSAADNLKPKTYSILKGRSMCPQCKHTLAVKDLVPVLSWLSLQGRCRYCHKPISVEYPCVELLTGLIFALFYLEWPFSLSGLHLVWFGYGIVYLVFFTALAVYDAKWFLLPDRLVFPLTALALSEVIVSSLWLHSWQALWQPVAGAALLFGLFWGIFQVSKGEWIGGGDVKLALALGLIAGTPLRALLVLFIASFIGTIVSLPGLLRSQKDGWTRHVPFGPYLLGGCFIIMLFADKLIGWYQRTLL